MRAGLWAVTLQAEFNDLQKTLAERASATLMFKDVQR